MTKKQFEEIVSHIWKKRHEYADGSFWKECGCNEEGTNPYEFDFPDYGGIKKQIANKLSSEAVDAMQNIWDTVIGKTIGTDWKVKDCKSFVNFLSFRKAYREELERLGERIH